MMRRYRIVHDCNEDTYTAWVKYGWWPFWRALLYGGRENGFVPSVVRWRSDAYRLIHQHKEQCTARAVRLKEPR